MSEEDQDSKTEQPTEKRLSEAIEKGNVPFARDVVLLGSMSAILAAGLLVASWSVNKVLPALKMALDISGDLRLDDRQAAATLLTAIVVAMASATLPVFGLIGAGTVIASLLQNVPSAAAERIMPKASRISPGAGWKRLFGKAGWIEFGKSCLKLIIVIAITAMLLWSELGTLPDSLFVEPSLLPSLLLTKIVHVIFALTLAAFALAIADLTWSRWKWRRDLRMTRHEVNEEMKQAEGDPLIKARIRSIGRQRASRRMLEKMPGATMVVANPTHFAVALRYEHGEGGAPLVVAKGVDHMAQKIREKAAEFDVPVVENKPLARALYDKVEIDQQIPPEFYRAVAEIIHYLDSRRRLPNRRN